MADEIGIDIIAICDHNSAENVQFAINAANLLNDTNKFIRIEKRKRPFGDERYNQETTFTNNETGHLAVLPGIEICSREEVHIIGLFDELVDVLRMQEIVYQTLPKEKNNPELFGEQIIANEFDEVEKYNERLLIGACNLSAKEIVEQIHRLNGIVIASHIDREAYSLIGQLGFIPEDLELDAVEISSNITIDNALQKFPEIVRFPIVCSSDAHLLQDIGKATTKFFLAEPTIEEIKMALHKKNGREISYE